MSEHIDGAHRKQTILFPDTLDEYVDEGNPVRFIDAFIDSLNLEKLGLHKSALATHRRKAEFRLLAAILSEL
jgi:transposase